MLRTLLGLCAVAAVFAVTVGLGGVASGAWDGPVGRAAASDAAGGERAEASARRRWARAVTGVCRSAQAEARAAARPTSPLDVDAYVAGLLELNRRYNRALGAIPAVPADRAQVARLHRLLRTEARVLAAIREANWKGDRRRLATLSRRAVVLGRRQSRVVTQLGARACGLERDFGVAA